MATIKETQIVEKLSSSNYSTWKFKLEILVIKEDLFELVTDEPPTPVTNDWQKKRQKGTCSYTFKYIEDACRTCLKFKHR